MIRLELYYQNISMLALVLSQMSIDCDQRYMDKDKFSTTWEIQKETIDYIQSILIDPENNMSELNKNELVDISYNLIHLPKEAVDGGDVWRDGVIVEAMNHRSWLPIRRQAKYLLEKIGPEILLARNYIKQH